VLVSIPSALLGAILYAFCEEFIASKGAWAAAVLFYGFATIAFPYSSAYYGYQIVAMLLLLAFYIAFLVGRSKLSSARGARGGTVAELRGRHRVELPRSGGQSRAS